MTETATHTEQIAKISTPEASMTQLDRTLLDVPTNDDSGQLTHRYRSIAFKGRRAMVGDRARCGHIKADNRLLEEIPPPHIWCVVCEDLARQGLWL